MTLPTSKPQLEDAQLKLVTAAVDRAVGESRTVDEMVTRVTAAFGAEWLPTAWQIAKRTKPPRWLGEELKSAEASDAASGRDEAIRFALADCTAALRSYVVSAALLMVALLGLIALLFPPFTVSIQGTSISLGFHFIFSPPATLRGHVDVPLLVTELAVIFISGGLLAFATFLRVLQRHHVKRRK